MQKNQMNHKNIKTRCKNIRKANLNRILFAFFKYLHMFHPKNEVKVKYLSKAIFKIVVFVKNVYHLC